MTALAFTRPVVLINGMTASNRQQITRDNQVIISVTFYDDAGNVVTPSTATITLSFVQHHFRVHQDYSLTQDGNVWSYTWDSSVANPCEVYGHVVGCTTYSVDFQFKLTANRANREEAGDDFDCTGYSI